MKFSTLRSKLFTVLLALAVSVLFVGNVYSQSGTTSITGTISDQNGAVVPGAAVTLSNPDTGFSRTSTTGEDGKFAFPSIPPATYQISVEAKNFKKLVNSNIKALVDSPIDLPMALEPGDVSAVVNITSSSVESIVNNQDASLGNNFVPRQITELPTDLRRVADLLSLQPAVTREGYVAGGRSDQANVLLDGIDINDQQTGGRELQFQTTQDTVLRATTESVEEFRITTTNANANQGRSSGAQISLVTRSGKNDFSGAFFYFYRPTAFSANDFFNNAAGHFTATDPDVIAGNAQIGDQRAPRPSLARDIFGGRVGGPIIKDRLFFFYTYEGQRQQQEFPVNREVPLAHVGLGQIRFTGTLPGEVPCISPGNPAGCTPAHPITVGVPQLNMIYNQIPGGMNPIAIAALASAASRYPSNNDQIGDGVNTGGFRFNAPTTSEENTHIARFDFKLNDKHSFFFRFNHQNDVLAGTSFFPDTPTTAFWDHPYGYVVAHDWAMSSNKINNFRYGLTRQAFSTQGDSGEPSITFRFVFSPLAFSRTLSRITPTHNFTDDFTWIKGNHTFQLGGNVRVIRNQRFDFGNAFDDAVTNPSFYQQSGAVVSNAFFDAGYTIAPGDLNTVQAAATAIIGRFSQYSGNFTFDIDGSVLPPGTPTARNFATEEYDTYFQDIWKPRRNLTLSLGLRYSVGRPVYEKNGFQVVPTERLGVFFERRQAAAEQGIALNDLIDFEKAGPANNGQGFYSMDWNNVQPRLAAAWSPNFKNRFLKALFGSDGKSVIRGGFAVTNDHFGEQLAVSFDGLSSIGFTSSTTIAANTYNVTTNPAPLFTGFNQNIRTLPGIPPPVQRFATDVSPACLSGAEWCPQRIETSLDGTIVTPTHYSWNVSYGRQLPWGMYAEASYIGRKARNLLAARDVMALNNLVDRNSGLDWYTAAGMVHDLRAANVPFDSPGVNIPYFNNIFGPGMPARVQAIIDREFGFFDPQFSTLNPTQTVLYLAGRDGYDILDWTFVQLILDDAGPTPNLFYHPQYAAFSSFGSTAKSDYNGASFSLRQRLGEMVSFDVNYTWSKSFDNASGLQTGGSYGSQFILNPLRPDDNYALSDFDIRHMINANFIFQVPIGKGQRYFSGMNSFTDTLFGGWQIAGIYRWNTGLPVSAPFDAAQWATNWNVQSSGTRLTPIRLRANRTTQNAFADPQAGFNSFRNARPGETGERNVLRTPGFSTLDMGLSKTFKMPWMEGHKLQFRWEVINVMNYQYFNADNFTRSTYGLPQDPENATAATDFGQIYTSIQGVPRRMQFGLRYSF